MTDFVDQDLDGSRFERVRLRNAALSRVDLTDATMRAVDLSGAELRGVMFHGARMRGVELGNVEISGEIENVTVNGVDIGPLVEEELNRRTPERVKMHPADAEGFREARAILGDPSPWHPLDLPWEEAPDWDDIPSDRQARPPLDTVLTLRRGRQAMVADVIASLTDEQLASQVSMTEPGWPRVEAFPFKECLLIVLSEEWEHRRYAERDLTAVEASIAR